MKFRFLAYLFIAAAIGVQACSKDKTIAKPQEKTSDAITTSSGLTINAVGDFGYFQILNDAGVAQISDNSTAIGGTGTLNIYTGTGFQKWKITIVAGNYYTLMNVGSGLYAQAYNYNGAQVMIQNKANNTDSQLWSLVPLTSKAFKMVSKSTGLAATWSAQHKVLLLTPYAGKTTQIFGYYMLQASDIADVQLTTGTYTISSAVIAGKAIGAKDASTSVGASVTQNDYEFFNNEQKWRIVKYAGGFYRLYNVFNDFALDIVNTTLNNKVVLNKPAQTDGQLWKIVRATSTGAYGIVNKQNGLYLTLRSGSTANGALVTQNEFAMDASRGWLFKPVNAIAIDTVITRSDAMKKDIKALVIRPSNYRADAKKYPVMYLLHGHGGNHLDYVTNAPLVRNYADKYGMIVVCVDGNQSSWYFNALANNPSAWQYETYVSSELVNWVDSHYRTIRSNKGRGVVGLSMGGHGALYTAFKHQDVFGAAGSMSGCVDIVRVDTIGLKFLYNINDRLGPKSGATAVNWTNNSVLYMTDLVKNKPLAINFDCDETDGFYPMNNDLHKKLTEQGTPHTYTHDHVSIFHGHSWVYWAYKLPSQFEFVSSNLSKAQ